MTIVTAGCDQMPSERMRGAAHQANAVPTHASKIRPSRLPPKCLYHSWFLLPKRATLSYKPAAGRFLVKQLIAYLLDNMILDFQGDLTLEMVRDFLRDDESREGRALLAKLVEDRGVSDMMITLADCLQDYLRTGISEEVLREQIRTYAES
jgi:hypothetical protein